MKVYLWEFEMANRNRAVYRYRYQTFGETKEQAIQNIIKELKEEYVEWFVDKTLDQLQTIEPHILDDTIVIIEENYLFDLDDLEEEIS